MGDGRFKAVATTKERRALFDDYCKEPACKKDPPTTSTTKYVGKLSKASASAVADPSGGALESQPAVEEEAEEGEAVIDRGGPLPQGTAANAFNALMDDAETAQRDEGAHIHV